MFGAVHIVLLAAAPLTVGTTLHPYYSWVANVVQGTPVQVRAVLPGDVDVGSYQPRPEDVVKLRDLDALVINGLGHDDFILPMLTASGNARCRVIRPSDATPTLKAAHGDAVNSHTFLSYSNAIQQTEVVARELAQLAPAHAAVFRANAAAYAKRLKAARAQAVKRLSTVVDRRVVTVHDGYSYLLHELGVELVDVVEPAHGLVPSAAELKTTLKRIESARVKVVLSEEAFPPGLDELLRSTGASVTVLSHIATGAYSAERFEGEMRRNVEALSSALEQR